MEESTSMIDAPAEDDTVTDELEHQEERGVGNVARKGTVI